MKKYILTALLGIMAQSICAQRVTDKLDRGLVAVPASGGGFLVSWRMMGEEYYDTQYNLYRNGTLIASRLTTSNYLDKGGSASATYVVEPVVRGVSQERSAAVKAWVNTWFDVKMQPVVNRAGKTIGNSVAGNSSGSDTTTPGYTLNDVSLADVDGDGTSELIVKRNNSQGNLLAADNKTDFNLYECYKTDGTRLWWIDLGPNLMAGADEQWDLIGYDWDRDGRAECIMRGADNMIIHTATGRTIKIGNMNYYAPRTEYTHDGPEYLLYLNGLTGEPYGWDGQSDAFTPMAYPLPRFETGESDYAAVWGSNDTGHRSSKHYFGAPYLDGRNPSIFLGRGCYTRHKACAFDVNPETHELTQRWRWNCYDSSSPWFGNGFHNFDIADVDMDGRDEIIFGSMVIDDNGYGLVTTGLGHGDAQHCGDLDPYRWGLEQFTCLEGAQGNSYWNATTGQMYYRKSDGGDDGRCLAGNFTDLYPGGQGRSVSSGVIGLSSDKVVNTSGDAMSGNYANLNNRIYWDGDLLDEIFNSKNGANRAGHIFKWGGTVITTFDGITNNWTKCNPSAQGDLIGDWREEVVLRLADNSALRIYVSPYVTEHALYSLWHDHQYRNAMAWQCIGYNQPPHPSFFLGNVEGITVAPPPLLLRGRTEVADGGTIGTTADHLLISGYDDKTIAVIDGASPYILTVNTPAWVQGTGGTLQNDGSVKALSNTPKQPRRNVVSYTTTLTGGGFTGGTRLVKQGEGTLVLPTVEQKHTGPTDVWNGTLQFDGTFTASPLWLNRHTTLVSNGGRFMGGLKADYNATIYPGGNGHVGTVTASTLTLGFGSRIVFDVEGQDIDRVSGDTLTIETKDWKYGPKYSTPVFEFRGAATLTDGRHLLGQYKHISGSVADLLVEGISGKRFELVYEDGALYLLIETMRSPATVVWNGTAESSIWDLAVSKNFLLADQPVFAVTGDDVVFDDRAASTTVTVKGAVSPKSITVDNTAKTYTLKGDSILGQPTLTKNGTGRLTITGENRLGATTVNGGSVVVNALANNTGVAYGALGDVRQVITLNDGATLGISQPVITDQTLKVSGNVGLDVPTNLTMTINRGLTGTGAIVTKTGGGTLTTGTTASYARLIVKAGTVNCVASANRDQLPPTVEFQGGTLWAANNESTNITNSANLVVEQGKTGTFYGGFRSTYTGKLTGAGTLNVYTGGVRCYFDGDWSEFTGTVKANKNNRQNKKAYDPIWAFRNTKGLPLATLSVEKDVRVSNEGKDIVLGRLTGSGTLTGSGRWILGSDNSDFYLSTEIGVTSQRTDPYGSTIAVSPSPVVKRGTGKMTLMTLGKLNGALTIEGGTVSFNNAALNTLVCGSNATTVKSGGRIVGQGLLNSVVLQNGAELVPCGSTVNETTPGTIKTNALLNAQVGSTVRFLIKDTKKYSQLQPSMLTFNGKLNVVLLDGYTPQAGDEFTLWQISRNFLAANLKPVLELPQLPEGLEWDTTGLIAETGVLRIVEATAVTPIAADAVARCEVYTLDGTLLLTVQTTPRLLPSELRRHGLRRGAYLVRMGTKTVRMMM